MTDIRPNSVDGTMRIIVNGTTERAYAHVISTFPLGALQFINKSALNLDYFQKNAIRKLKYAFSSFISSPGAVLCPPFPWNPFAVDL